MPTNDPGEGHVTPREGAESEEQEIAARSAAERRASAPGGRPDDDDPREEEGWTQPESSAQKGAARDEG